MTLFLEVEHGRKVFKSGFFLIIVDGCNHCRAIEVVKEQHCILWTGRRFRVRLVMRNDGVYIKCAEMIKLSKVRNTLKAIVRRDKSFVNPMKCW